MEHFICDYDNDCKNKHKRCISCRHYNLKRPDYYETGNKTKQTLHNAFSGTKYDGVGAYLEANRKEQ